MVIVEGFPTRFEASPKRVRVVLGGEFIADTLTPLLVWEIPYFPFYYIPVVDVKPGALIETGQSNGVITYNVRGGEKEVDGGAHRFVLVVDAHADDDLSREPGDSPPRLDRSARRISGNDHLRRCVTVFRNG